MGFGVSFQIEIARSSRTNQQIDESEGSLGQADYWEACANIGKTSPSERAIWYWWRESGYEWLESEVVQPTPSCGNFLR